MASRMACATALSLLSFTTDAVASDAVDFAASLIGRPYVWGAEGPDAFDCSGLTQYVYQRFGIELPRRAISQSREGDPIRKRLQRGISCSSRQIPGSLSSRTSASTKAPGS